MALLAESLQAVPLLGSRSWPFPSTADQLLAGLVTEADEHARMLASYPGPPADRYLAFRGVRPDGSTGDLVWATHSVLRAWVHLAPQDGWYCLTLHDDIAQGLQAAQCVVSAERDDATAAAGCQWAGPDDGVRCYAVALLQAMCHHHDVLRSTLRTADESTLALTWIRVLLDADRDALRNEAVARTKYHLAMYQRFPICQSVDDLDRLDHPATSGPLDVRSLCRGDLADYFAPPPRQERGLAPVDTALARPVVTSWAWPFPTAEQMAACRVTDPDAQQILLQSYPSDDPSDECMEEWPLCDGYRLAIQGVGPDGVSTDCWWVTEGTLAQMLQVAPVPGVYCLTLPSTVADALARVVTGDYDRSTEALQFYYQFLLRNWDAAYTTFLRDHPDPTTHASARHDWFCAMPVSKVAIVQSAVRDTKLLLGSLKRYDARRIRPMTDEADTKQEREEEEEEQDDDPMDYAELCVGDLTRYFGPGSTFPSPQQTASKRKADSHESDTDDSVDGDDASESLPRAKWPTLHRWF